MNDYTWAPEIGARVRLKNWHQYAERGIHAWAWLRVERMVVGTDGPGQGRVYDCMVLDGDKDTGKVGLIPASAMDTAIGWHERYTIEVPPDKTQEVIGWLARGIAVCQSHYMPTCPTAFQPLDNCETSNWRFSGDTLVDKIPAGQAVRDRIRIVEVETIHDAFVMRECRYCVKGKRTRENNPALIDKDLDSCPTCGAVEGFSFNFPYHGKEQDCRSIRKPAECWVCNGTGQGAKYIAEFAAGKERKAVLTGLRTAGWKVWYAKRGWQHWIMEMEKVVKEWGMEVSNEVRR